MDNVARIAAAVSLLTVICACGTNEQPKEKGNISLEVITSGGNCAIPVNLDHVTWSIKLFVGKDTVTNTFTAVQLTDACAHATTLTSVQLVAGDYFSTLAGF